MNDKIDVSQSTKTQVTTAHKHAHGQFIFKPLSIQQRLPLFICVLLTAIVLIFSWFSYVGVKEAGMAAGNERVTTLTNKLSVMFKGSVDKFATSTAVLTKEASVQQYLTGSKIKLPVLAVFRDFLAKDTTNKSVELLDVQQQEVLHAGDDKLSRSLTMFSEKKPSMSKMENGVGRIIVVNKEMYFPVTSAVTNHRTVLGYVVNWKHLRATPQSIEQFGQLLGANGKLYFGNDDGQFWTNLIQPVAPPPVPIARLQTVTAYSRKNGDPLLGAVKSIPHSRWIMLVELSATSFQQTAHSFLRRVALIGTLLILVGSLGAWLMSRSITKPIKQLGYAASAIADGNYSLLVHIDRNDELGSLAESFNIMAVQVRAAKEHLEHKVEETNQELVTAIRDAEYQKEIERKKDEFISIASHELKTPLTTIKAFFQLAAKDIPAESRPSQFIDKAARQLTRMEHLIGDLLDASTITAGKMQYHFEMFDFQELLQEAISGIQALYPDHRLVLETSVAVNITADKNRIEQVIVNLLTNAVKYSPGKKIVVIRSEIRENNLKVGIEDFGIGIEQQHIGELFDRFQRVNANYRFQGLGLGLFISAEIIKRHGGCISVKSEPGNGSVFSFQLPLAVEYKTV